MSERCFLCGEPATDAAMCEYHNAAYESACDRMAERNHSNLIRNTLLIAMVGFIFFCLYRIFIGAPLT